MLMVTRSILVKVKKRLVTNLSTNQMSMLGLTRRRKGRIRRTTLVLVRVLSPLYVMCLRTPVLRMVGLCSYCMLSRINAIKHLLRHIQVRSTTLRILSSHGCQVCDGWKNLLARLIPIDCSISLSVVSLGSRN